MNAEVMVETVSRRAALSLAIRGGAVLGSAEVLVFPSGILPRALVSGEMTPASEIHIEIIDGVRPAKQPEVVISRVSTRNFHAGIPDEYFDAIRAGIAKQLGHESWNVTITGGAYHDEDSSCFAFQFAAETLTWALLHAAEMVSGDHESAREFIETWRFNS